MKNWKRAAIILGAIIVLLIPVIAVAAIKSGGGGPSPDRPAFAQGKEGEEEEGEDGDYLRLREQYIARLRGIEPGRFANPLWRARAVGREHQQQRQQRALRSRLKSAPQQQAQESQQQPTQQELASPAAPAAAWSEIGPDSVANGQALDGGDTAVSGRVTAIAVDPTDSNKVYLGTAQGGVWRSLDGGANWTPIFDSAQSLSIGALAIAPSSPSTALRRHG